MQSCRIFFKILIFCYSCFLPEAKVKIYTSSIYTMNGHIIYDHWILGHIFLHKMPFFFNGTGLSSGLLGDAAESHPGRVGSWRTGGHQGDPRGTDRHWRYLQFRILRWPVKFCCFVTPSNYVIGNP
jgi:hypothetical protein